MKKVLQKTPIACCFLYRDFYISTIETISLKIFEKYCIIDKIIQKNIKWIIVGFVCWLGVKNKKKSI